MKRTSFLLPVVLLIFIVLTSCRGTPPHPSDNGPQNPAAISTNMPSQTVEMVISDSPESIKVKGEVWADNWFAFYLGDRIVQEDSVAITTERSFNSETFIFEAVYPMNLNFIVKDFKENDSGLEYIGTTRQQMGDGGFIAQFTNVDTGELIAVTDASWVCTVIHEAPLDKSCEQEPNPVAGQMPCGFTSLEEPVNWKSASFDDSSWSNATVYTESQVSPKDGYDQISWDSSAQLIWGADLETNNTLLCRLTIAE